MNLNTNAFDRFGDTLVTVDSHTAGEPTRLVVGGMPVLPGADVGERRRVLRKKYDHLRRRLTREPRGHRDIFAAVVVEPTTAVADFGLIYMDARRYPYMCGHATIGAVTTFIDMGWLTPAPHAESHRVVIDTPSGPVAAEAALAWRDGRARATAVAIQLMPSFVSAERRPVNVPGVGRLLVDVVNVGGYFAMVSSDQIEVPLTAANAPALARLGMAVIDAANAQLDIRHPTRPEVNTIDVTEFYDSFDAAHERSRSAVVYGEAHVDRSPCGTGTAAKMALFHRRGHLAVDSPLISEGLLGGDGEQRCFVGRIVGETAVGPHPAIIPEIHGSAHITGLHRFVVTDDDPFPNGFML